MTTLNDNARSSGSNKAVFRAVEHVFLFCLYACAERKPQVKSIAVSLDC